MKQLIYLSLTKWNTYEERPHHFVRWYHERSSKRVVWIDPYPTRLPSLGDLQRTKIVSGVQNPLPKWMDFFSLKSLPVEPLPLVSKVNYLIWNNVLNQIKQIAEQEPSILVVGKPSKFALLALEKLPVCESWFDIMDSYSDFYQGYSKFAMHKTEEKLIDRVDKVFASSTNLINKWAYKRKDIELVLNGLTTKACQVNSVEHKKYSFGYLGSMSQWFDWDFIYKLAMLFPSETILLIGPVFSKPKQALPQNIKISPPMNQEMAFNLLKSCQVGLIPFKRNKLTEMVDPIKYYEYVTLGLPVLTTDFGQMSYRTTEQGVFVVKNLQDLQIKARSALRFCYESSYLQKFVEKVNWDSRFRKMIL